MDTTMLTENLLALRPEKLTWKLALYSTKKSSDGLELEWNGCKMQGLDTQADKLRDYLLKKPVAERPVTPYSPFLPDKENIGAFDQGDEMIRGQILSMLADIQRARHSAPEDFLTGVLPKPVGFAIYGERRDAEGGPQEQILFMRRGNPFLSPSSGQLFTTAGDEIVACGNPILKFPTAVDFLLAGGVCYFLSSSIEKDFELENRYFAIAKKQLELVAAAKVAGDYEQLEACVLTAKNARKFLDFNKAILEHIAGLSIPAREEFLGTYGVSIDHNGFMDTADPDQCELIVDLLCCRSCLDPLGRLSVGSNIMPRE